MSIVKMDKLTRNHILGTIVILAFIIFAFLWFMRTNEANVLETNTEYAASTTTQTAQRVDDLLQSAQHAVSMTAGALKGADINALIDINLLSRLTSDSMFDYMAFC